MYKVQNTFPQFIYKCVISAGFHIMEQKHHNNADGKTIIEKYDDFLHQSEHS